MGLFFGALHGFNGLLNLIVLFVLEVFVFPDACIQRGVADGARVEDHIVALRIELGQAQVGAGGLQGVEEEAGGFVVDLLGHEQAHDLHEGDLDGVGVFENGEDEGGDAATGAVGT